MHDIESLLVAAITANGLRRYNAVAAAQRIQMRRFGCKQTVFLVAALHVYRISTPCGSFCRSCLQTHCREHFQHCTLQKNMLQDKAMSVYGVVTLNSAHGKHTERTVTGRRMRWSDIIDRLGLLTQITAFS